MILTHISTTAYFVGRNEILDWLNTTLRLRLSKIEETASGAVACQVFDILFPGVVQMSKVNWGAKSEWEFVGNYKILQAACDRMGVDRKIEVDRLIKAKHQDNLEFLQWLKKFYDDNSSIRSDYDPQARRLIGKNTIGVKWANVGSSSSKASEISPKTKPLVAKQSVEAKPVMVKKKEEAPPVKVEKENAVVAAEPSIVNVDSSSSAKLRMELELASKEIARLQAKCTALETRLETCEKESRICFGTLGSIDTIIRQPFEGDVKTLIDVISQVLYVSDNEDDPDEEQQHEENEV
jgi:RP/EB family microtubule-associated protein